MCWVRPLSDLCPGVWTIAIYNQCLTACGNIEKKKQTKTHTHAVIAVKVWSGLMVQQTYTWDIFATLVTWPQRFLGVNCSINSKNCNTVSLNSNLKPKKETLNLWARHCDCNYSAGAALCLSFFWAFQLLAFILFLHSTLKSKSLSMPFACLSGLCTVAIAPVVRSEVTAPNEAYEEDCGIERKDEGKEQKLLNVLVNTRGLEQRGWAGVCEVCMCICCSGWRCSGTFGIFFPLQHFV